MNQRGHLPTIHRVCALPRLSDFKIRNLKIDESSNSLYGAHLQYSSGLRSPVSSSHTPVTPRPLLGGLPSVLTVP